LKTSYAKGSINIRFERLTKEYIRADPRQLKQALINLLRNAAKSIVDAGTITVRLRGGPALVENKRRSCVFIDVEDTGVGVPRGLQQRLFDPFFTTKETGTGLGLSIAARIIERHGGVLTFQTRPHKGTIFSVVLPAARNGAS
jgi:signal transduction histidine kinase